MKKTRIEDMAAPQGMSGIAVAPWSPDEIYAVAADWSQASSPVLVWGDGDWVPEPHGRQVADFRHDERRALRSLLVDELRIGGDRRADDEIAAEASDLVNDAEDIRSYELGEMAEVLAEHGDHFTANDVYDAAQEWLDHDFESESADAWCQIGVWNAAVAADCCDAGLSPEQVEAAAAALVEGSDDPSGEYTDGCPIYAACNGDLDVSVIIDAARAAE